MPKKTKKTAIPSAQGKSRALPALSRTSSTLSGIYNRLPIVPFLDRQTSAILYMCIAAYFLFIAYMLLTPIKEESSFTFSEGALAKNANLSLAPGENYLYSMEHEGQRQSVSYSVKKLWNCKGVVIVESEGGQSCVYPDGSTKGEGGQQNSTLGNSTGLLFIPWMLAVSDSFSWKVTSEYWNGYFTMRTSTNFTSLGKSSALGRDAYLILVQSDIYDTPTDYYVDSEKRVLLYARSGNTTAWLVSAPFELDSSQIPKK